MGIASGNYGFAVLLDKEGNDVYDAYTNSIAYGEFGMGILEDDMGIDHYYGFSQCEGVAFVEGIGYLVDRGGDDVYEMNDTVIDSPAPQSDKHNNSMGIGAATGYRRDYTDVHSLAGGIGLVFDQQGNDTYSCGIFGEGVGYWEGVGALWDSSGNDSYLGQWYVQGAAAHYAVGYLEDGRGNDLYTAGMNMAQGAGHDFSIGYLIDRQGNDTYHAPNLSLGAGNSNGIGIFADLSGDDTYVTSGTTLGMGNPNSPTERSLRDRALCLGVFLDLGGTNTYPASSPWAKQGAQVRNWAKPSGPPEEGQLGVFFDKDLSGG